MTALDADFLAPPHSTEAEESVVGSLLIDPDAIGVVANILKAEDFYHPRNRDVYRAMLGLMERGQPTDFVMVCDEMTRLGSLAPVGGEAYLGRMLTVVPTSVHVEYYAQIVVRTAVMRRLIQTAGRIAALAYEDDRSVDDALAQTQALVDAVLPGGSHGGFLHLRPVLADYLDGIQVGGSTMGGGAAIPSGFLDLDRLLGGLHRSDLIVLAARPGMGKSSLALSIAREAAVRFNATVAIFSLEMSRSQVAQRFLSMETEIDSMRIQEGRLSPQDLRKMSEAVRVLSLAPIYIDDSTTIGIADVRNRTKRMHAAMPIDLLIVDYLQLLAGSGQRHENRVLEMEEISRGLKGLAREINAPVLALSQLNRSVEQRHPHIPILSDLRNSGSIEQDADVVAFIYREDQYDRESEKKGIAEIHVAKHRSGPTGVVSLLFMERTARFVDLMHSGMPF